MSESRRPSPGHAATLLVLLMLVLMTCAAVYIVVARIGQGPPALGPLREDIGDEAAAMLRTQQLTVLLTILLISALLILLFVLGAYLLLRVGRIIARQRVGGKPTTYVDAWGSYRLTDEQIARATAEDPPAGGTGPPSGGSSPETKE